MREDVAVVRREGGKGKDRARLKRWITAWSWARTCMRMRSCGSASGSLAKDVSGFGGLS